MIMDDGKPRHSKFTREQKIGVALLFVFSLLTIGLGFLQMRNNLVNPFVLRAKENKSKSLRDFQVELQRLDTDQDGINDYEELNFYSTSPYLPDTDSDGKADKLEIDTGADPLCPEGKICSETAVALPNVSSTMSFSAVPIPSELPGLPIGQVGGEPTPDQIQELLNNPAQIRELLRATGKFTDAQLGKFTDAALIKLVKEIMTEIAPPSVVTTSSAIP